MKVFVIYLSFLLVACTHQPLSWDRTAYAAQHAATHPSVWAPVLGASVLMIDNLDNRLAEDMVDDTAVFGSSDNASDTSDDLESLLTATALISALAVPVPEGDSALEHRADHLAVTLAGLELTGGITDILKTAVGRERPDKSDDKSFPSGHASQSFAAATFASTHFHRRWGESSTAQWADASLYTVAGLTAWARVEAAAHHPADVLAGAALGNFIARFFDELMLKESSDATLSAYFDGKGFSIGITQPF